MNAPRVIFIGGAPLVGKSTLARALAAELGYSTLCTDDLAVVARTMTTRASHPGLHPMDGEDYREYYLRHPLRRLIAEAEASHAALWPAIAAVIAAHLSWAGPLVLEGWALRPERVVSLPPGDFCAFWLVTDRETLEPRLRRDRSFWEGASDPEMLIARFADRSLHADAEIRRSAQKLGQAVIECTASISAKDLYDRCLTAVRQHPRP